MISDPSDEMTSSVKVTISANRTAVQFFAELCPTVVISENSNWTVRHLGDSFITRHNQSRIST